MLSLAHFTVEELPGTAAIFVSGFCLALAIARRGARLFYLAAAPLLLVAVVAAGADHDPLFASIAGALGGKQAFDLIWLGLAIALAAAWLRPARSADRACE